jgi:hypothetical protein
MSSHDITKDQAKVIHDSLYSGLNYLARLNARMQELGWTPDDKLFQLAGKAYNAMRHLYNEVHYLGCNGVGRPDRLE